MFLPIDYPRLIIALFVSPQVSLVVFIVASLAFGAPLGELEMGLVFYVPFAYFVEIILGMPLFLLSRRLRWKNVFAFIGGGALIGITIGLPMMVFFDWANETVLPGRAVVLLLLAVCGLTCLASFVFWLIMYGFKKPLAAHET
jgi:hypothetical protein